MSAPSRFRKRMRETADCETARWELLLYMAKCCGKLSPIAPGVRETKRLQLRPMRTGSGLRSHRSNRNKIFRQFCVERSVHVEVIVTREVGARVHGRSNTEEPLSATRAWGRNCNVGSQGGYRTKRQSLRVVNDLAKKLKTK